MQTVTPVAAHTAPSRRVTRWQDYTATENTQAAGPQGFHHRLPKARAHVVLRSDS